MCDLTIAWNKTRSKAKRFAILNRVDCPRELILKALTLYDPKEVMNLDAIWARIEFTGDADLETIERVVNGKYHKPTIKSLFYASALERNTICYVVAKYTPDPKLFHQAILSISSARILMSLYASSPIDAQLNSLDARRKTEILMHLHTKKVLRFSYVDVMLLPKYTLYEFSHVMGGYLISVLLDPQMGKLEAYNTVHALYSIEYFDTSGAQEYRIRDIVGTYKPELLDACKKRTGEIYYATV
jgi:hypothetical protein